MDDFRVIQVYHNNPYVDGQGGGNAYVRNLFHALIKRTDVEALYWGVAGADGPGFVSICREQGLLGFVLKFCTRIAMERYAKFTVLHFHRLYFACLGKLILQITGKGNVMVVSTVHGETFHNLETRLPAWLFHGLRPLLFAFEAWCIKVIGDGCCFVSERNREFFSSRHPQLSALILSAPVLSSMVDFECRSNQSIPFRYVMLGRLSEVKDHDFVFEIIQENSPQLRKVNFVLDVYGDGELMGSLDNYVKNHGLSDLINLHGSVSHSRIQSILVNADTLLLPSKNEAAPTVILEAISCGCFVMAADVGFASEVLSETSLGVVLPKQKSLWLDYLLCERAAPISEKERTLALQSRNPIAIAERYIESVYSVDLGCRR